MPDARTDNSPAPVAVIDALNSLLEAELGCIIRFMGEGSPYLGRADAEIRRPLAQMVATNARFCTELATMIEELGGTARTAGIQPEAQYLAYLSLKFLLPKLVAGAQLTIRRYENTLRSIPHAPPGVIELLQSHVKTYCDELKTLSQASDRLNPTKSAPAGKATADTTAGA